MMAQVYGRGEKAPGVGILDMVFASFAMERMNAAVRNKCLLQIHRPRRRGRSSEIVTAVGWNRAPPDECSKESDMQCRQGRYKKAK